MQYSAGSVNVTYGSRTVRKNGTASWAGIRSGAVFGVQGEGTFYTVSFYSPGAPDQLQLTSPYRGTTNASALYVICNDFTPWLRLPLINRGDLETSTIFDYCMIKLESTYSGIYGDMFKVQYDQDNNGVVDTCDYLAWSRLIGVPTGFVPAAHAASHLDNGTDPIPVATISRTGSMAKLSGNLTDYLNGHGSWTSLPGLMLQGTYDVDNNGVVDTCDALAWSKLTGVPASFWPSNHAPTHLDNGSDAIPVVTTTRTGLTPKLSGTNTTFLNGTGTYTTPTGQPLVVKGFVANSAALPTTGNTTGDIWIASDTNHAWSWNGTAWVDIGPVSAGPPGPVGPVGAAGIPAYTHSTVPFTIPAVGSSVTLTVADASWMTVGEWVWVATAGGTGNAGSLLVTSIVANTITLKNPVATIGAGPPGPPGPTGAPGSKWYNGHGPPPGGLPVGATPVPGDYYLDVDTGLSYVLS
jgi:hypothetical protein